MIFFIYDYKCKEEMRRYEKDYLYLVIDRNASLNALFGEEIHRNI